MTMTSLPALSPALFGFMGQFPQGDRRDRRPDSVVANLAGRNAQSVGYQLGNRQAALASLAWPHAATAITLHLVGTAATDLHIATNLAGSDFLTAADNGVVGWNAVFLLGTIERVQEGADK